MFWTTISSWDLQLFSSCVIAVATAVIAVATVFYVIGTFRLWKTTQKSVDATNDAFKLNFIVAVMQAETPQQGQDNRTDMMNRVWHQNRWKEILRRVFPDNFESFVSPDKKED